MSADRECAIPSDAVKQLDSAVAEAFDLMLGLACLPVPPSLPCPSPFRGVAAAIRFSGTLRARFHLEVATDVCATIAARLLGTPCHPDDPMVEDSIGELGNVIAGGWKSRLGPELASSHMSIPTVLRASPAATEPPLERDAQPPFAAGIDRAYGFADHLLMIRLWLDWPGRPVPRPDQKL